jgi:hypothetical protein
MMGDRAVLKNLKQFAVINIESVGGWIVLGKKKQALLGLYALWQVNCQ